MKVRLKGPRAFLHNLHPTNEPPWLLLASRFITTLKRD